MKYINFFDAYATQFGKNFFDSKPKSYWVFKDEYLGIHKILYGVNEGKIQFRFFNDIKNDFSNKFSMMSGSVLLLNTKYVDYSEIRQITIGNKSRKVQTNTKEYIFNTLIEKSFYDSADASPIELGGLLRNLIENLKILFGNKLEEIATESDNLGEIFDKLKIFPEEVLQFQKDHFEKWELDRDTKKYNL